MKIDLPTPLLGGLSPRVFMKRHWQKRPLLIRQAVPGIQPALQRRDLFELAGRDDVESRLVTRDQAGWSLRHGPLRRRAIPSLRTPGWTLLVQGLDLHVEAAHELLERFRFIPDARLDDVMMSYATDAGGVGPHLDSYDVFLLQVHGEREWRIGRIAEPKLDRAAPLKILTNFVAEQRWTLAPGDMLYLPPRWAHDGVARGECMTYSIGFRAPTRRNVASEVLQRLLDVEPPTDADTLYRDAQQSATETPAQLPGALLDFATRAVARELSDRRRLAAALGELLSEPKNNVVFEAGGALQPKQSVRLDRRTRMVYDALHVFINGESYRASGRDAALLRRLADRRELSGENRARMSESARLLLADWAHSGWLRGIG